MVDTFVPIVNPVFPLSEERAPKMKTQSYGDGYFGMQPDGLNNDLQKPALKWENLSREESKSLQAFLEPRAKSAARFYYTVPWYNDGSDVQLIFFIVGWGRSRDDAGAWSVTATLQQVVEAV